MKPFLALIFSLVVFLQGCRNSGQPSKSDLELIKESILALNQDSLFIEDGKAIKVFTKSSLKESNQSSEKFASLVTYIIHSNYHPTSMNLKKEILITISDNANEIREYKCNFEEAWEDQKKIDKAFEVVLETFEQSSESDYQEINSFRETNCYQTLVNHPISEIDLEGMTKSNNGNYDVYFQGLTDKDFKLLISFNKWNNPKGIFCGENLSQTTPEK